MKRLLLVLFIAAIVFTSCQTKTKVLPADLTAAKVAVSKVLDTHWKKETLEDALKVLAGGDDTALEERMIDLLMSGNSVRAYDCFATVMKQVLADYFFS